MIEQFSYISFWAENVSYVANLHRCIAYDSIAVQYAYKKDGSKGERHGRLISSGFLDGIRSIF